MKNTVAVVDKDAIEIGKLYERSRSFIVQSVEYLRQCGQMLLVKKESLTHGEWLPWLEQNAGTLRFESRRTAAMLMKAAKSNGKLTSQLDPATATQISRQVWGNKDSQLVQQSLSNEHYTPSIYLDAARAVLGTIDLDPASCEEANLVVQADRFLSEEENALADDIDWFGQVWLNPPYGSLVGEFIAKLAQQYHAGNVTAAIVLVNAHCTDTAWFQALWDGTLCFTDHRINFYGDDNRSGSTHGRVFAYFGPHPQRFVECFGPFGEIVKSIKEKHKRRLTPA